MARALLSVLSSGPCTMIRCRWRDELGEEALGALQAIGWLRSAGRADWYPCGGDCGGVRRRVVLEEPVGPDLWLAVCGHEAIGCLDEEVPGAELEELAFDTEALVRWLREALGASGTPLSFADEMRTVGLGRVSWEGEFREAMIVLGGQSLLLRLLDQREQARAPSLVLAPSLAGLSSERLARHGLDKPVVLVELGDLLALEGGRLLCVPARSGQRRVLAVREPASAPYGTEPGVARVIEAGGSRVLSAREYAELVGRRASFDLFLDLTAAGERRGFPAGRRDEQGVFVEQELSPHEASVLAELVQTRRALRARDFRTLQASTLARSFERARKKVDVKLGRYQWRAFQTQSGSEPGAKRFVFSPPDDLLFAVVVPIALG